MLSFFEILFLIGNLDKISKGKKPFLRGNLICYTSGMEGRRKLKFGKVGLICQNFSRKKSSKKDFRPEYSFNQSKQFE